MRMDGSQLGEQSAVRFGVIVLPNKPWPDLVARWRRLEDAGIDSIWSCDHFTNPHRPGQPWFEAWAGLAALTVGTTRVRVGLLVGAVVSRSPQMFVKQARVVDHITRGRLDIGLGAGGAPTDQARWGVGDWTSGERAARFAEYVDLVDRLTREEEVSFDGQWYRAEGALMAPGLRLVRRRIQRFLFYDPPYSRARVPCADPDTVDEVLSSSLTRLCGALD